MQACDDQRTFMKIHPPQTCSRCVRSLARPYTVFSLDVGRLVASCPLGAAIACTFEIICVLAWSIAFQTLNHTFDYNYNLVVCFYTCSERMNSEQIKCLWICYELITTNSKLENNYVRTNRHTWDSNHSKLKITLPTPSSSCTFPK